MLLSDLRPAALQNGLAIGGDIVARGPERSGRGRFQPQPLAGVRIVDAVIRGQQRPYRALVVADDAVGDAPGGGQQLVVWHHFGDQSGAQRILRR